MRISHEHRFVFLANPRTGSTTVRRILDPYSDVSGIGRSQRPPEFPFGNHITAPALKAIFDARGWRWDAYWKFCVVRNPWDRVVSLHHHRQGLRAKRRREASPARRLLYGLADRLQPEESFERWVAGIDPTRLLPISLESFACDAEGRLLVDDVLRFERLHEELPAGLAKLGIDVAGDGIPHLNESRERGDYRSYYDDRTRERVAALYAWEIERFGYRF